MSTLNDLSTEFTLTLTEGERAELLNWLQQRRRNTLVEEHRTDHADYRKYVLHQEAIIEKVIAKLSRS